MCLVAIAIAVLVLLALAGCSAAPSADLAPARVLVSPGCACTWTERTPEALDGVLVSEAGGLVEAVAEAGESGVVLVDEVVEVCGSPVYPLAGSTWSSPPGARGTIRRCDEVRVELPEALAAGSTVIPVDGFGLGDWLVVADADGTTGADGETTPLRVVEVADGSLVVHRPTARSYEAGDLVVGSFPLVRIEVPDVTIADLDLDGNAASHATYRAWEAQHAIQAVTGGDRARLVGLAFVGTQADAVLLLGVDEAIVADSYFGPADGSAVHLSDTDRALLVDLVVDGTNANPARIRHAEAAITWSYLNRSPTIRRACVDGRGSTSAALGSVNVSTGNTGIRADAVRACDLDAFVLARGEGDLDLVLRRSVGERVGPIGITGTGAGLSGVVLDEVVVDGGSVLLSNVRDVEITASRFDLAASSPLWSTPGLGVVSAVRVSGLVLDRVEAVSSGSGVVILGGAGAPFGPSALLDVEVDAAVDALVLGKVTPTSAPVGDASAAAVLGGRFLGDAAIGSGAWFGDGACVSGSVRVPSGTTPPALPACSGP